MLGFDVVVPDSAEEAFKALEEEGAYPLAGGTSLLPRIYNRRVKPRVLVSLNKLENELRYVKDDGPYVRIGSLAKISDLLESSVFEGPLEAFRQVSRLFGSWQVRNVATVGGNIATASLVEDLIPVLLVLGAKIKLVGKRGERIVPIERFYSGKKPDVRSGEIIEEVFFERRRTDFWTRFEKIGRRAYLITAIVNVAVLLEMDPKSRYVYDARIATNAAGRRVAGRAKRAESELKDRRLTEDAVRRALEALSSEISPRNDFRASSEYRRLLAKALVRDALNNCSKKLGGQA